MNQNYTPIDDLIKKNPEPVSGSYREGEPPLIGAEIKETAIEDIHEKHVIKEVVEHVPPHEVKKHLHSRLETVVVPPDLKKIGVQTTGTLKFPSYQNIKLPVPDEVVYKGLHAPFTSSLRWLAELCLYLLKRVHLTLKDIHGKIVRVVVKK